jgi:hypothetical protein
MITLITGVIGIVATLLAWFLNPRRQLYAQIDQVYKDLEADYVKRDIALAANDSDTLTIVTFDILRLCTLKTRLLQRLG